MKKIMMIAFCALTFMAAMAAGQPASQTPATEAYSDTTVMTDAQWDHALAIVAITAVNQTDSDPNLTMQTASGKYGDNPLWGEITDKLGQLANAPKTLKALEPVAMDVFKLAKVQDNTINEKDCWTAAKDAIIKSNTAVQQPANQPSQVLPQNVQTEEQEHPHGLDMNNLINIVINVLMLALAVFAVITAMRAKNQVDDLKDKFKGDIDALRNETKKREDELKRSLGQLNNYLNNQQHAESDDESIRNNTQYGSAQYPIQRPQRPQQQPPQSPYNQAQPPHKLFLSKADRNGQFIKATDKYDLGNSIFELSTSDGKNGTFRVIDSQSVHEMALMMPTDYLTRVCSGDNIQLSQGKHCIVTDTPGTARYESGHWVMVTKAAIHYEA